MKNIVIFGGASGLGAEIAEFFAQLDHRVTVVGRMPSQSPRLNELGINTMTCDATTKAQVEHVVEQFLSDSVVISTMGSFKSDNPVDYIGHRYLIDALEKQHIQRFILVTSLGCGDSWKYLSEKARDVFGHSVREKSLAESWLQTSKLPYTIIRPGGLLQGKMTGQAKLTQQQEVHGCVNRQDIAFMIEKLLLQPESEGQNYECVDPSL